MVRESPGKAIARKQFTLQAARPRVWDLLAAVIYRQLPLERVNIVGLDRFEAVLRWKFGFLVLPFDVLGRLTGVSRPDSYGCAILIKKGPVKVSVNVGLSLEKVDETHTEITCLASAGRRRNLIEGLLEGQMRGFSVKIFDSIEARLKQLTGSSLPRK